MSKEKIPITIPPDYKKFFCHSSQSIDVKLVDMRLIASDSWASENGFWTSFYAPVNHVGSLFAEIKVKYGDAYIVDDDPRSNEASRQSKPISAGTPPDNKTEEPATKIKNGRAYIYDNTGDVTIMVETLGASPSQHHRQATVLKRSEKTDEKETSSQEEQPLKGRSFIYDNKGVVEIREEKIKVPSTSQEDSFENEEEMEALITKKLIPLIENYQKHLAQKGKGLSSDALDKVKAKQDILVNLLGCLRNNEQPRAVERVRNFYSELNTHALELSSHRDPYWTRFVRNSVICAGILITAILPGLIALLIYANIDKNTPRSMQFWNSQGKNVVDALQEEEPQSVKDNPLEPQ